LSTSSKIGRVENIITTNLRPIPFVEVRGRSAPLNGNGSRRLSLRIKGGKDSSNAKFVEDQVWAIKQVGRLPIFGFCFSREERLASTDHDPDEFFNVLFYER